MITNLRDDIKSISRQAEREKEEAHSYEKEIGRAQQDKNQKEDIMKVKMEEIQKLEKDKLAIQAKLKEKESERFTYKFKIKDLQKTKKVLTHRS